MKNTTFYHQKTTLSDGLVYLTNLLNDWPDNLKRIVAYKSHYATKKPPLGGSGDSTKVESDLDYHLTKSLAQNDANVKYFGCGDEGICTPRTLGDNPGPPLWHPHTKR